MDFILQCLGAAEDKVGGDGIWQAGIMLQFSLFAQGALAGAAYAEKKGMNLPQGVERFKMSLETLALATNIKVLPATVFAMFQAMGGVSSSYNWLGLTLVGASLIFAFVVIGACPVLTGTCVKVDECFGDIETAEMTSDRFPWVAKFWKLMLKLNFFARVIGIAMLLTSPLPSWEYSVGLFCGSVILRICFLWYLAGAIPLQLQKMMFPKPNSQVPIKSVLTLMILCRGDNQATVEALSGGFCFLWKELQELRRHVVSDIKLIEARTRGVALA